MQFQKILSYDVYGQDPSRRFDYVCSLLDQSIDPPSLESSQLTAGQRAVFISPRLRAISCLNSETATEVTIVPALNEIPFDLRLGCTAEEFAAKGSVVVRQTFIKLFVEDKLNISHHDLKNEFDYLLSLSEQNKDALAVSHTFRLKLLETYLKTNQKLFAEPTLIHNYLNPTVHFAHFGSFIDIYI
jgi:hypothetical protein